MARGFSQCMALALTVFLLCLSTTVCAAQPRLLAVMELSKGAGSAEYDGMGMALSGLIVDDLFKVEQLRLVERQRVDEVVGEIALADGKYIDPKTAQKMGRGLGAEFILLGSYSVVGKTFVMDGRIVDVASGEVKGTGSSTGTIDEFVAVQKDLIDQIIKVLNIELGASAKRKLMLSAQTESFQALSAYGEGLKRQKQGKADDAKAAFERAAQIDPEFAAAKAALSEMRSKV
jgi:TolB-like protein